MKLVDKKVKAGETETVIEPEEEAPGESADVIDLSELLARSLKGGKAVKAGGKAVPAKAPARKQARKAAKTKTTVTTTARKRAAPKARKAA